MTCRVLVAIVRFPPSPSKVAARGPAEGPEAARRPSPDGR